MAWAGGILGVWREAWRLGAYLRAQTGARHYLSHIYSMEPAHGEAGEEGVASCPQGTSRNAPHLHSTCRRACFTLQL